MACKVQARMGHHIDANLEQQVGQKLLTNFPVKVVDITNAIAIFGPESAGMRGRTVQSKLDRVETDNIVPIPRDLYRLHKFVTLTADVMFVNGIVFMTTLSRRIRLSTIENVESRTAAHLSRSLEKTIRVYARISFTVCVILLDMEFEKVADELDLVTVNILAVREHVAAIEQGIR